jgi:hypothetical protein
VRASFSSELIFGVGGGFQGENRFRLVTSAATPLATVIESALEKRAILKLTKSFQRSRRKA